MASQKRLPEHVNSVARVGARKLFIERTDQNHPPEALDGSRSLSRPVQPLEHGSSGDPRRASAGARNRKQRLSDASLVGNGEPMENGERRRQMQRRRKPRTGNGRAPTGF